MLLTRFSAFLRRHARLGLALPLMALASTASAQSEDLAKQLANPIASLISFPIQSNLDFNIGPSNGTRLRTNIQPVIPFTLNDDWNVISRTIVPVIWQENVAGASGTQFGLGDTLQSLFFSPSDTVNGFTWGVGPVLQLPTGTDPLLGAGKWGAGPTAVVLKQAGPWTVGALANHVWSFAGDSTRGDVSNTFLQPFLSYTTSNAWTFSLNTESVYNWTAASWTVPINTEVRKLVSFGEQPVSLFAGLRYWAVSPANGPSGLGVRAGLTFLFPR
jgi:hypothetical protein